jgi:hypothetical protein
MAWAARTAAATKAAATDAAVRATATAVTIPTTPKATPAVAARAYAPAVRRVTKPWWRWSGPARRGCGRPPAALRPNTAATTRGQWGGGPPDLATTAVIEVPAIPAYPNGQTSWARKVVPARGWCVSAAVLRIPAAAAAAAAKAIPWRPATRIQAVI